MIIIFWVWLLCFVWTYWPWRLIWYHSVLQFGWYVAHAWNLLWLLTGTNVNINGTWINLTIMTATFFTLLPHFKALNVLNSMYFKHVSVISVSINSRFEYWAHVQLFHGIVITLNKLLFMFQPTLRLHSSVSNLNM